MGTQPVTNQQVLHTSGPVPILVRVRYLQLAYMGHASGLQGPGGAKASGAAKGCLGRKGLGARL
eukprot:14060094-Alexandrium_andersonii.AAC.1